MSDVLHVPYPARLVDPNEPGLIAGYDFQDNELSVWGKYTNKCARAGAAYDLTTRVGTPLVGQGGGIYVDDHTGSYWSTASPPVGAVNFSYTTEHEWRLWPPADRNVGYNHVHRFHYLTAVGALNSISFDNGATLTTAPTTVQGHGPYRADALYDGTNQILVINGRQVAAGAVVPQAPAGTFWLGLSGTVRLCKVFGVRRTVAQARASYVKEFARRVVYSWRPAIVGEGPAGGIATGAVGEGDWYCPSGGASLAFVWRNPSATLRQGQLALTDSGALSLRRLDFAHTKMPLFGAWHFRCQLRDPATDNPRYAFLPARGTDFTAAGSGCTWAQIQRAVGVMQATLHLANGAAAYTINHTAAGVAGDTLDLLVTHAVNGDWRSYLAVNGVWASNADNVVWNDVTQMQSSFISIAPRQSYVLGDERFQSELTPGELGR